MLLSDERLVLGRCEWGAWSWAIWGQGSLEGVSASALVRGQAGDLRSLNITLQLHEDILEEEGRWVGGQKGSKSENSKGEKFQDY